MGGFAPTWDSVPGLNGAGAFTGGAWKVCEHTTEGSSYAGARGAYAASGSGPHFTDSFEGGIYRAWQHLPLNVAATALRHPAGTGQTNRDNVIQIEHVGFAAQAHRFPQAYLEGMAMLDRWISAQVPVPQVARVQFEPGAGRLDWPAWHATPGHVGHQHCPYNEHTDPGALDVTTIIAVAGGSTAAPPPVPYFVPAPIRFVRDGKAFMEHIVPVTIDTVGNGFEPTDFPFTGSTVKSRAIANPRPPDQGGNGRYKIALAAGLETAGKLDVVVMGADPSPDNEHRYVIPIQVDVPD